MLTPLLDVAVACACACAAEVTSVAEMASLRLLEVGAGAAAFWRFPREAALW